MAKSQRFDWGSFLTGVAAGTAVVGAAWGVSKATDSVPVAGPRPVALPLIAAAPAPPTPALPPIAPAYVPPPPAMSSPPTREEALAYLRWSAQYDPGHEIIRSARG